MNHHLRQKLIPLLIALYPYIVGFTPSYPSLSSKISPNLLTKVTFPPSGNRGAPKTTIGGGTRGEMTHCLTQGENTTPLVALMPNRENIAQTATLTPTLYIYVPDTIATTGELVIVNSQNQEVYQTQFALPKVSGIIKVKIPARANLKPENTYKWSFMVICDPRYRYKDKSVEGQLEMVKMPKSTEENLKNRTSLEKAMIYATSNLWFETLDTVAQLRTKVPEEWTSLLQSVGLELLAEKPLIGCCLAE
jgi:hypothetical protein